MVKSGNLYLCAEIVSSISDEMNCKIIYVDKLPAEVENKMSAGFKEYESNHGIEVNYKRFSLFLTTESDDVVGVLNAFTAFAEIYIDDIWVDKNHRHQGYGRKLIQALEDHFNGKGFNNINLVTSAFQAPEFYKKCGFTIEFVRDNKINPQFTKTFLVKYFNESVQKQGLLNTRRTSRAIILNANNEILLLKVNDKPLQDKSNRKQSSFWVTVGGEVEDNESVEEALQRELHEEAGFTNPVEFELVAFGEQVLPWKGLSTRFIEKFFIVRTDQVNLDNRNLTCEELKVIGEYRWWTIDELLKTKEVVFPGCLAILIKDYINSSANMWVAREIALD